VPCIRAQVVLASFEATNSHSITLKQDVKILKEWLRNVTHTPHWAPQSCMAVFPASGEHKDAVQLQTMHDTIKQQGFLTQQFIDDPVPVDGSTMERMRENLNRRNQLCMYDEEMQKEFVVHFMCYHKERGEFVVGCTTFAVYLLQRILFISQTYLGLVAVRMLVHFYCFLFFEDWRDDLWMKRYVGVKVDGFLRVVARLQVQVPFSLALHFFVWHALQIHARSHAVYRRIAMRCGAHCRSHAQTGSRKRSQQQWRI